MWWCQFIDWLKFETRPSPLLNFGMANGREGAKAQMDRVGLAEGKNMFLFLLPCDFCLPSPSSFSPAMQAKQKGCSCSVQ